MPTYIPAGLPKGGFDQQRAVDERQIWRPCMPPHALKSLFLIMI